MNEHKRNYSRHQGFGNGQPTSNSWEDRAIKDGRALTVLPNAHHTNSPYVEVVWSPPGFPPGQTRFICNQNNWDEMYFTDSHYAVYWKVWGQENTHVVFA
ncbi:MAG TPA: hypothetical protein VLA61_12370 [Ideonella sp.]|nr:hypothetical protein [Ideonella sp.]